MVWLQILLPLLDSQCCGHQGPVALNLFALPSDGFYCWKRSTCTWETFTPFTHILMIHLSSFSKWNCNALSKFSSTYTWKIAAKPQTPICSSHHNCKGKDMLFLLGRFLEDFGFFVERIVVYSTKKQQVGDEAFYIRTFWQNSLCGQRSRFHWGKSLARNQIFFFFF